jgi:hypothetical protein
MAFSFSDLDSDIVTRIPDRPARKIPVKISMMPEIPWLASKYEPQPSEKPTFKSVLNMVVKASIPIVGIFAILVIVGFAAMKIVSLY